MHVTDQKAPNIPSWIPLQNDPPVAQRTWTVPYSVLQRMPGRNSQALALLPVVARTALFSAQLAPADRSLRVYIYLSLLIIIIILLHLS